MPPYRAFVFSNIPHHSINKCFNLGLRLNITALFFNGAVAAGGRRYYTPCKPGNAMTLGRRRDLNTSSLH